MGGCHAFETVCVDILTHLFVPPLCPPILQARTLSGIDRRDAIFPNRNFQGSNHWANLLHELNARMILFEFKNYDKSTVGKEDVDQACGYMREPMGRLGIIVTKTPPSQPALIRRNSVFNQSRKVILFITPADLIEMLNRKDLGKEPSDVIVDLLEAFYIQHE